MTLKEMFLNYLRTTEYYYVWGNGAESINFKEDNAFIYIMFLSINEYDLSVRDCKDYITYTLILNKFYLKLQQKKRFEKKFPEKGKSKIIKI